MFWQLSLPAALEASLTHKAYRVGSQSGVWVVSSFPIRLARELLSRYAAWRPYRTSAALVLCHA